MQSRTKELSPKDSPALVTAVCHGWSCTRFTRTNSLALSALLVGFAVWGRHRLLSTTGRCGIDGTRMDSILPPDVLMVETLVCHAKWSHVPQLRISVPVDWTFARPTWGSLSVVPIFPKFCIITWEGLLVLAKLFFCSQLASFLRYRCKKLVWSRSASYRPSYQI